MTDDQKTVETPAVYKEGAVAPRSPVHAVLLTLLMTGLGHVYCGELVIGLIWATVGAISGVISLWALANQGAGFVAASIPMWFVTVAAAVHAWSTARHCPRNYQLRSYNRWYVYVLLLVLGSFGGVGHGLIVKNRLVEAYVTPSTDMEPTLLPGDRFLVDKTAYVDEPVKSWDVVVFKSPEYPERTFVKRVAALEGETVEIRDGQIYVNEEPVGEVFPGVKDFGPQVVPRFNFFVIGDNLAKSKDSRHFGPVPQVAVVGKAVTVFWPQQSWYRMGNID